MSRHGIIITTADGKALISTSRRGVCDACAERIHCSFESGLGSGPTDEIWALNPVAAAPGDVVEFDLPEHSELKLSFLVWGIPMVGLIAGAFLGGRFLGPALSSADLAAALGAAAGFILSFIPLIIYDRLVGRHPRFLPRITHVLRGRCEADSPPAQ